ncbi:hypothetical protein NL676_025577 [Syzygium grande]|nr:hypothetical protein NL676_025577 [Syzygium grande]
MCMEDIFTTGIETSATRVDWTLADMMKNPRVLKKVQAEMNGYEIPVKTEVAVNAWTIGRDTKHWVDPKAFYPGRFKNSPINYKGTSFEYVPFGAGRRICPGMNFGLANVELPLAMLLNHFDWELPEGMKSAELEMRESLGVTQRRKRDMYLFPKPYQPTFTC